MVITHDDSVLFREHGWHSRGNCYCQRSAFEDVVPMDIHEVLLGSPEANGSWACTAHTVPSGTVHRSNELKITATRGSRHRANPNSCNQHRPELGVGQITLQCE